MPIVLSRIDQRLIHGITVNDWNAVLSPKRFMVIDDLISSDEVVKSSMRMSKPAGTGMSIISTGTAITNFKAGKYDAQAVFVIVKEPATLLALVDAGITVPAVNVGVIFNEDGRVPVTSRVALNGAEAADLRSLQDHGLDVTFQYRPNDEKVSLDSALKGKF
ncbi:PTS sugar transporter subunit IIB [uncultured Lacticaseibacillus sp.]|jgi:PTS system mannose-specific IIB component|uniref:PTS sugar transporter subunit IIB n=1 Tax=uncultured Lacticaseibacillus sp. TaxID=2775882 RepID=UPI0025917400|nr:PTS sugar transporter subunit IIB [uncultured Lacticaseibacillus sp.]